MLDAIHEYDGEQEWNSNGGFCNFGMDNIKWCATELVIEADNESVDIPLFVFGDEEWIEDEFPYYQCCSHSDRKRNRKRNRD